MSDSPICEWVKQLSGAASWDACAEFNIEFNTGNDERVIGILTTGPKPIFLQCDNKLQMHRESRLNALTALQFHARAKDSEPTYIANCGPIIGKPF
ncbi:hypothetical protein KVG95_11385 [Pseudomonas sp. SWRI79]|uniref:Uncharacterized protein n=1 Tax=Pseudomonas farris TaxID=2841207 RepID=A0ABS6PTX6_9PSED|nr:hypothetical protein [Pseudomonas farris]MBV4463927.1 hypothetical protein [Pseudomonas farris]